MKLLIPITIAFACLRIILPATGEIHQEDIFKDLAHIWVGVLLGVAITLKKEWLPWILLASITVVEILCFIASKP